MIRRHRPSALRVATAAALLLLIGTLLAACVQPPPPTGDAVWGQSEWDGATWQ